MAQGSIPWSLLALVALVLIVGCIKDRLLFSCFIREPKEVTMTKGICLVICIEVLNVIWATLVNILSMVTPLAQSHFLEAK